MTAPPLPATLAKLPEFLLAVYPAPALVRRSTEGAIENLSTSAVVDRVAEISLGLMSLGVGQGDRVAIICESRPEWLLTDLGAQTAGAIVVPVYPTLTPAQTHYILADAGSRVAVVSTSAHAAKVLEAQDELAALETIVVIDPGDLPAGRIAVRSFESLVAAGRAARESDPAMVGERQARIDAVRADDLATIIYTSGTTGQPKGVMLTHDNILSNVRGTMGAFPPIGPTDVGLTFLPPSHALERTALYLYLCNGVSVAFAESMETIARDLSQVAPTLLTGVPRFYEKLHSRILTGVQSASAVRRGIFAWALRVGVARARARLAKRAVPLTTAIQWPLADALVFKKLRQRVGGNLRFFVSGSAPLAAPVAEFFYAAGLPIVEGYGLTETSPVLAVNPADAPRYGTVGHIIPGVEVKIADDGEILARGPNVMRGYYNRPSDTEAAIKDGWFYTGDIGHIDADGYLSITDRKKELIVTAGGKKIAPQPIEGQLKTDPLVGEVVVIGDRRKFAAALIVPDFAWLERQARQAGITIAGRAQLVADPRVRAWYQAVIDGVNAELGQFERIKKFVLLPREFTQEAGELTPTLKVKRKVVQEKLKDVIEELYGEA